MMKKKNISFLVLFALMSMLVSGQVNVIHVNNPASQPAGNGIYYNLPRTFFKVDVVLHVEERLKGTLSEHAERFLGITDAIKFDNTYYEIGDIVVSSHTEPDPDAVYYVEMGQRDSRDPRSLLLEVDETGYLLFANTIDKQFGQIAQADRQVIMIDDTDFSTVGRENFISTGRVNPKIDTILRRVAVDTILTEQMHFRFRTVDKPSQELAAEIMEKIEDIRDSRFQLITGFQETPYETGTIKFMETRLEEMEQEYIDLFRGKTFSYLEKHTFYYVPDSKPAKSPVTLFKFSNSSGINTARSGAGENVELLIQNTGTGPAVENFAETKRTEASENGIAYRIPEQAVLKINIGKEELLSERFIINQFGAIKRLPSQKFKASFDPKTGNIRQLFLE
jgi:hypothetical protein